jgi:hypothetical protein
VPARRPPHRRLWGPLGEGGALCHGRVNTAVPVGPPRPSSITHPDAAPATVTCRNIVGWHRWILGWGNLVHYTTTTKPSAEGTSACPPLDVWFLPPRPPPYTSQPRARAQRQSSLSEHAWNARVGVDEGRERRQRVVSQDPVMILESITRRNRHFEVNLNQLRVTWSSVCSICVSTLETH